VSALEDPNPEVAGEGHARLRKAGIAVEIGLGAVIAERDHAGHIRRMRDGRPHVMLKLAISADGKVAAAGRRPVAITGGRVRERVHLLRAQSDAIMIGIDTALADDPILTCRLPGMAKDSPLRVILDSGLRLPAKSRLIQSARETPLLIVAGDDAPAAPERDLRASGADVVRIVQTTGRLDLPAVLKLLANRGITRLMVEGGPTLAAALIAADLVDEAILFLSGLVIGDDGVDAFAPQTLATLDRQLARVASEPIGPDRQDHYERG
jgi:diaminohydroxyphosphoribosylaminopyrimidine deaminase/5-amino-6-(5-phosphoribosylamino)uracil reductase